MGVYVYKINRRSRTIPSSTYGSVKIHESVYAFRCGRNDDACHARYVAPMKKKWDESGESIKDALFVMDYEDGANVYRRNSVAFYDTGEFGEIMGHLRMNGTNGKLRFEPEVEKGYKVTFRGATKSKEEVGRYPDHEIIVTALNEMRAKKAAAEILNAREDVKCWTWHSQYPLIEKYTPPMDRNGALSLAMRALDKSSGFYSLTDRVNARKIIKEMMS